MRPTTRRSSAVVAGFATLGTLLALVALPTRAAAQASQFGVRGLGIPARGLSARALSMGGAPAVLDPESPLNPATIGGLGQLTATFNLLQDYRSSTNPAGTASGRDTHFPAIQVGGPIGRLPLAAALSFSSYAVRDFSLATNDTVTLREVPVAIADTFTSRGGINDVRAALSWQLPGALSIGVGVHAITGVNRLSVSRTFADSAFFPIAERSEEAYHGIGVSIGLAKSWPGFAVGLMARSDGHVNVDQDTTTIARVGLPYTVGVGFRWRAAGRLELAGSGIVRTWRDANKGLLDRGGSGADNTIDIALGGQLTRGRDVERLPVRFGAHYRTLPFPFTTAGTQPREFGVSLGSGIGFSRDQAGRARARIDLGLEQVWRKAGPDYSEHALMIALGVVVRP